ncbi:hypothetical protein [Caulobacter sp.]|uniref:hypothetical protein n=1 Tax=Caulobacter sp. TaxID=78 RepID=UPI003BB14A13
MRRRAHRQAWADLLVGAADLARQVIDQGGDMVIDRLDLFGPAKMLGEAGAPTEEATTRLACDTFLSAFRALRLAGRPQRKVIMATLVLACAQAVDDVFADEVSITTEVWRKRLGAGD